MSETSKLNKLIIVLVLMIVVIAGIFYFIGKNKFNNEEYRYIKKAEKFNDRQDFDKDFFSLQKASEFGDATAQYKLGLMYQRGVDVTRDLERASHWLQKSSDQGNIEATYSLAVMHHNGLGFPQDKTKATELFLKVVESLEIATEAGDDAVVQTKLGFMFYYGRGVEKNYRKAMELFKKASDQGNAEALYWMGRFHCGRLKYDAGVKDEKKGLELLNKSADQGYAEAFYELGKIYHSSLCGVEEDREKSRELFLKAADLFRLRADQNEPQALYILGRMYEYGQGVSESEIKSCELYKKASELLHGGGLYELSVCYQQGKGGISKDLDKFQELYDMHTAGRIYEY